MRLIGLTGGIGSGKSTVAAGLAQRGAAVVDADRVAHQVVEPGGPAYDGLVARFGTGIVGSDGRIDRPALAAVAFADSGALADLNRITHPAIGEVIAERIAAHRADPGSDVVVIDLPLLDQVTAGRWSFDGVVVVDTPVEEAVRRVVSHRGLAEADARARVAAQVSRSERRALAGLVIDNSGSPPALEGEIDRAWTWIRSLRSQS